MIVPAQVVHSVKFRVDTAIAGVSRNVISREDGLRRLTECGPEGALYLASLLEALEPDLRVLGGQGLVLLKNPAVRAAALDALGILNDADSFEYVSPLCDDPDPGARTSALRASVEIAKKRGLRESLLWALSRAPKWPSKGGECDLLLAAGACGGRPSAPSAA